MNLVLVYCDCLPQNAPHKESGGQIEAILKVNAICNPHKFLPSLISWRALTLRQHNRITRKEWQKAWGRRSDCLESDKRIRPFSAIKPWTISMQESAWGLLGGRLNSQRGTEWRAASLMANREREREREQSHKAKDNAITITATCSDQLMTKLRISAVELSPSWGMRDTFSRKGWDREDPSRCTLFDVLLGWKSDWEPLSTQVTGLINGEQSEVC